MKILFLTTYDVPLLREHFFTINVITNLIDTVKQTEDEVIISTASSRNLKTSDLEFTHNNNGIKILTHQIKISDPVNPATIVEEFKEYLKKIQPDIIHSQMTEGYDIEAAKSLNIPIVTTIHIGGIICPRGGGEGFLKYDDSICNQPLCKDCSKCMAKNMPFPSITYLLHKATPSSFKLRMKDKLKKNLFYVTPFLNLTAIPRERKEFIELLRYSHLICANPKLLELLKKIGLKDNLHLLPHGVKAKNKLPLPSLELPVKFYFLGRIQYAKGLHILIKAFKDIPKELYELHIIGHTTFLGKKAEKYYKNIKKEASNINIHYHGRVPNNELEETVKDFHVMIHPAIFHEVYGIAIAESLSMGRPVLATRCGGSEIQVIDNYNGWLVDANNVEEMKNKILHIIKNKDEIIKFSKNCQLPHSLNEYGKKLLELYNDICG